MYTCHVNIYICIYTYVHDVFLVLVQLSVLLTVLATGFQTEEEVFALVHMSWVCVYIHILVFDSGVYMTCFSCLSSSVHSVIVYSCVCMSKRTGR